MTNKSPLFDLTGSKKANGLGGAHLTYTSHAEWKTVSNEVGQNLKKLVPCFN